MKLRRDFLASLVRLAGVSAIGAVAPALKAEAATCEGCAGALKPPEKMPAKDVSFEGLPSYARAQNYKSMKQSSWDRKGGNYDAWPIDAGATREVFAAEGPGVITHLWFTLVLPRNRRGDAMKAIVMRIYWDGNEKPSVEAPLVRLLRDEYGRVVYVSVGVPECGFAGDELLFCDAVQEVGQDHDYQ